MQVSKHGRRLCHSTRIFNPSPLSTGTNNAAINNKKPILDVMMERIPLLHDNNNPLNILEIGSGKGCHINYFADSFKQFNPHWNITWQPTDRDDKAFHLIDQNITDYDNANVVNKPFVLDLSQMQHRINIPNHAKYDMVFAINIFHVTSMQCWHRFIRHAFYNFCNLNNSNRMLFVYGPFNLNGQFTTQSNQEFDAFMRETGNNCDYYLKDITQMNEIANNYSWDLSETIQMPANNFCLIFRPGCINVDYTEEEQDSDTEWY